MFTVRKGNETQQVSLEEALRLQNRGWTIVSGEGFTEQSTTAGVTRLVPTTLEGGELRSFLETGRDRAGQRFHEESPEILEAREAGEQEIQAIQGANTIGELGTLGIEAADALTFGAATAAGEALSPGFRENRLRAREQFDDYSMAGRVVGTGLGLFTGTGAAGLALRAERAVQGAGGLGRYLFGGTLGGGLGGAGEAVTEAVVTGDSENLAERIAMDAAFGAMFGLVAETGLQGLGAAARRGPTLLSRDREFFEDAGREALLRDPQSARRSILDMFSGSDAVPRRLADDVIDIETNGAASFRELRAAVSDVADEARLALREIDPLQIARREGQPLFRSGGIDAAVGAAQRLRRTVEDIPTINVLDQTARAEIDSIITQSRQIERLSNNPEQVRNITFPQITALRDRAESLVAKLPSDKAANLQQALNDFTGSLDDAFDDTIVEAAGVSSRLGRMLDKSGIFDGKDVNVSRLMKQIETSVKNGDTGVLDDFQEMMNDIQRAGVLRGTTPEFGRLQRQLEKFENYAKFRSELQRENQSSAALSNIAGAVGFAAGGGVGGAAGLVGGKLLAARIRSPYGFAVMKRRVQKALGRQATRANRLMDDAETGLRATTRVPNRFSLKSIKAAKGTIAHHLINGSPNERREEYERLAQAIDELAVDPLAFQSAVSPHLEGGFEFGDELPAQLGLRYHTALQVLQESLPRNRRGRRSGMLGGAGLPPSQSQIDDFLITAAAVEDPLTGFEMALVGGLTPTAARGLMRVYPQLHTEMVNEFITRASRIMAETPRQRRTRQRRDRARNALNYQMILRMSNFAQMPLDDSLNPEFVSMMQSQYAQTPAQERAQFGRPVSTRGPGGVVDSTFTASQRVEM